MTTELDIENLRQISGVKEALNLQKVINIQVYNEMFDSRAVFYNNNRYYLDGFSDQPNKRDIDKISLKVAKNRFAIFKKSY